MNDIKKLKAIIAALASLAAILAIVFFFVWRDRQSMIEDLTLDKEELTQELVSLQGEYSVLSSDNDSLNVQLDREIEKVDQLLERIQKTEASNRSKIRQYEKELGTLRSIMKHYIVQIDSLNTLNNELRKDAADARRIAKESTEKYEKLSKTTDEYAKLVEKGSAVKGRGVNVVAINKSNKETERSSRVVKLRTCLSLVENSIAAKGPMTVYIRVKGPDGILMTNDQQRIFTSAGEQMIYTESREVDYQGSEVEVCVYFGAEQGFTKGVYTVEVYTTAGLLGTGDILLR
jgi:myosin heavy subunit